MFLHWFFSDILINEKQDFSVRGKYTSAKFLPGFRSFLYCYSVTLAKVHRGMNLPVIWVMEYFHMLWGVCVWKAAPLSRDGEQPSPQAGVQCSQTPLALCTEDLFAVYLSWQCPRLVRCGNAVFVCAGKAKRCLISVDGDLGRRRELRTGGGRQSKVLLGRWAGNVRWDLPAPASPFSSWAAQGFTLLNPGTWFSLVCAYIVV